MTVPMVVTARMEVPTYTSKSAVDPEVLDEYILESLGYTLGRQIVKEIEPTITPSEVVDYYGEPEYHTHSVEVYVFTKEQLEIFAEEMRRGVKFDMLAYDLLRKCNGPTVH